VATEPSDGSSRCPGGKVGRPKLRYTAYRCLSVAFIAGLVGGIGRRPARPSNILISHSVDDLRFAERRVVLKRDIDGGQAFVETRRRAYENLIIPGRIFQLLPSGFGGGPLLMKARAGALNDGQAGATPMFEGAHASVLTKVGRSVGGGGQFRKDSPLDLRDCHAGKLGSPWGLLRKRGRIQRTIP